MPFYISLLRGINVTGYNMIKMTELKNLYESLGFTDVVTYIQSGNVVFKSGSKSPAAVAGNIVGGIKKKFGLDIAVMVRRPEDLHAILRKNPFVKRKGIDSSKLYVTFLGSEPEPIHLKAMAAIAAKSKDEFKVIGREIHLCFPIRYSKSVVNNSFLEKYLRIAATTRNWNTVNVLAEMARNAVNGPKV